MGSEANKKFVISKLNQLKEQRNENIFHSHNEGVSFDDLKALYGFDDVQDVIDIYKEQEKILLNKSTLSKETVKQLEDNNISKKEEVVPFFNDNDSPELKISLIEDEFTGTSNKLRNVMLINDIYTKEQLLDIIKNNPKGVNLAQCGAKTTKEIAAFLNIDLVYRQGTGRLSIRKMKNPYQKDIEANKKLYKKLKIEKQDYLYPDGVDETFVKYYESLKVIRKEILALEDGLKDTKETLQNNRTQITELQSEASELFQDMARQKKDKRWDNALTCFRNHKDAIKVFPTRKNNYTLIMKAPEGKTLKDRLKTFEEKSVKNDIIFEEHMDDLFKQHYAYFRDTRDQFFPLEAVISARKAEIQDLKTQNRSLNESIEPVKTKVRELKASNEWLGAMNYINAHHYNGQKEYLKYRPNYKNRYAIVMTRDKPVKQKLQKCTTWTPLEQNFVLEHYKVDLTVDQIADKLNRTPRAVKECAGRLKRAGIKKYDKYKYWVPEERSYVLDTYKDKYPRQIGELIDDLNRSESSIQQEYHKLRNDKEYIDELLVQKDTPQKTKDITNTNSSDRVTTPIDKKQEEYDDIEEFVNL